MTFGGTSGAAPHVTGAAMLWMNWVKASFPVTEPGSFYLGKRVLSPAPTRSCARARVTAEQLGFEQRER
jgi:hypothetical protein